MSAKSAKISTNSTYVVKTDVVGLLKLFSGDKKLIYREKYRFSKHVKFVYLNLVCFHFSMFILLQMAKSSLSFFYRR